MKSKKIERCFLAVRVIRGSLSPLLVKSDPRYYTKHETSRKDEGGKEVIIVDGERAPGKVD